MSDQLPPEVEFAPGFAGATWSVMPGSANGAGSHVRTTTTIASDLVVVFKALCYLESRRPSEMATCIVNDRLLAAQSDPFVADAVRVVRIANCGLSVIPGGGA